MSSSTLTPRIEWIYRGSEWARIFNEPGLDKVPAYNVVNLNFTYAPANSRLRLSVTGAEAVGAEALSTFAQQALSDASDEAGRRSMRST